MPALKFCLFALLAVAAGETLAGGSSASVAPGARTVSGRITEWAVPTHKLARDPAIGPDGNVYFVVRAGDKIGRFNPRTKQFNEWNVPTGTRPRGTVVARDGHVLFGGVGDGVVGELDPISGKLTSYKLPSADSEVYTLVLDANGDVWLTERKIGKVAKLERFSGRITEYPVGEDPYGLSLDKRGIVWVTRRKADRLVRLNPSTGQITELAFANGSQPRRTAIAPDGMLWVSLYGIGKLAKINPAENRVEKVYDLPGGPNAGPYAVNADANGRIWVSEIQTDNIIMLDPRSGQMRTFKLPTKNTGVRKAAIDGEGRYWYVGTNAGKLGMIE